MPLQDLLDQLQKLGNAPTYTQSFTPTSKTAGLNTLRTVPGENDFADWFRDRHLKNKFGRMSEEAQPFLNSANDWQLKALDRMTDVGRDIGEVDAHNRTIYDEWYRQPQKANISDREANEWALEAGLDPFTQYEDPLKTDRSEAYKPIIPGREVTGRFHEFLNQTGDGNVMNDLRNRHLQVQDLKDKRASELADATFQNVNEEQRYRDADAMYNDRVGSRRYLSGFNQATVDGVARVPAYGAGSAQHGVPARWIYDVPMDVDQHRLANVGLANGVSAPMLPYRSWESSPWSSSSEGYPRTFEAGPKPYIPWVPSLNWVHIDNYKYGLDRWVLPEDLRRDAHPLIGNWFSNEAADFYGDFQPTFTRVIGNKTPVDQNEQRTYGQQAEARRQRYANEYAPYSYDALLRDLGVTFI